PSPLAALRERGGTASGFPLVKGVASNYTARLRRDYVQSTKNKTGRIPIARCGRFWRTLEVFTNLPSVALPTHALTDTHNLCLPHRVPAANREHSSPCPVGRSVSWPHTTRW